MIESANRLLGVLTETIEGGEAYRMLVEVSDLVAELRAVSGRIAPPLGAAVEEARRSLAAIEQTLSSRETRQTLRNLEAATARLPQAVGAIEQAARRLEGLTADADRDLGPMLRELRATAENLRAITETMRQYPSQVLFGAPPPREPIPGAPR
jgi:ABC-type transporter Mla subunit MlaD